LRPRCRCGLKNSSGDGAPPRSKLQSIVDGKRRAGGFEELKTSLAWRPIKCVVSIAPILLNKWLNGARILRNEEMVNGAVRMDFGRNG